MKKFTFLLALLLSVLCLNINAQQKISQPMNVIPSARELVKLLAQGDFSHAVEKFDSTMQALMPEEKTKELWDSIVSQIGHFKKQTRVIKEKHKQYQTVFITCEFEKSSVNMKIVFNNKGKISGLWILPVHASYEFKPPPYANPDSFTEKEIIVGSGKLALPGTLTLPKGTGPFPAVVLVHGSGPNDRDETIGPNKPFRDLAWGLASQGIAVLRYEKRTKAYPAEFVSMIKPFTVKEETIEDALKAVALLRHTDGIDPKRIFLLGHSLGGMLAPRIGALDSNIAGFIIMAGTTRPLEDVILEQMSYIASLKDTLSKTEKIQMQKIKEEVSKIKALTPSDSASGENLLGAPPKYWLDLRNYGAPKVAARLKQPMLILQGERDYRVTMKDFQNWKKTLASKKNVEFKTYPELNHLFIAGKGKITPGEYQIPGQVAETMINDIARWIKKL